MYRLASWLPFGPNAHLGGTFLTPGNAEDPRDLDQPQVPLSAAGPIFCCCACVGDPPKKKLFVDFSWFPCWCPLGVFVLRIWTQTMVIDLLVCLWNHPKKANAHPFVKRAVLVFWRGEFAGVLKGVATAPQLSQDNKLFKKKLETNGEHLGG